ncbi:hypothetical protein HRI_001109100 [Hibiscus trionum]|uniref:KIB1-4 beta-propeller domain-containing protein n=1 Tax=Hibiscus trionum TaxID=183268 RepID=A0A9W7HBT2_HIBTR|nr:hypothetical protein HRI_001109100 [Hibiscus trionum]
MGSQSREKKRDWSKLPKDIVGCIMGKLYWSHRIQMQGVCKAWRMVSLDGVPTIDKAWLMTSEWSWIDCNRVIGKCKLKDTSLGKEVYISRGVKEDGTLFIWANFQSSRYGWALFRHDPKPGFRNRCVLYMYSPFTDEMMKLPPLDLGFPVWDGNLTATFNLSSANSECLVFCFYRFKETVCISTCLPRDGSWKSCYFVERHPDDNWYGTSLSATYSDGCFYCLFSGGALGVFDVHSREWKLLVKCWPAPHQDSNFFGELVAFPRCPCLPHRPDRVMKFDPSGKCWVEYLDSQEMESASSDHHHHLCAYLYPSKLEFYKNPILIEPPVTRVWRRRHLLNPN